MRPASPGSRDPGLIQFEAGSAGGNPLIPGAPDIDTYLIARFDFGFGRLAGGHRKQSLGRLRGPLTLKDNFELSMSYTAAPSTI
jgi:hypothetical protein